MVRPFFSSKPSEDLWFIIPPAMDSKTLHVLEYDKILDRLAGCCDFSASADLAHALQPSDNFEEVQGLLAETTEARFLLSTHELTIGGSHDIRPSADLAARGGVLDPQALLEIKTTLVACRDLKRSLAHAAEKAPRLARLAVGLPEPFGIIDAVSRVLSERGEVLDSASDKLANIRREGRVARDRLMSRLQKYLADSANKLQEPIITQRDGRYVIPLRAEFKGQIKAVVHDQSSSGATLFVEPLPVVELNNQVRELELAERDEERRILAELSAQIGSHAAELKYGIENLAVLDLAFAKAKYAEELRASEPVLQPLHSARMPNQDKREAGGEDRKGSSTNTGPQPLRQGQVQAFSILLLHARHPLLDPQTVVPIDVNPKAGTRALVITGPNTGGKTVSLKTVGLLALMAQSGLHIPAQSGSELPCFHEVFADIGDEQSIEQSLSTFSAHITNIIRILKKSDSRSLVILDELGAGTDPQEGAALARAILSQLIERDITTFVATHYPELKTFAHSTDGVVNASLEFDVQTLRPTYHLTIGLPGRSNALAIAQRLGLDPSLVAAARSEINPDDLRADKLLDDIRKERNRTAREREKLEKSRSRLEAQAHELEKRLEKIEDERRAVLAKARAEGELEVAVLKQNIESLKGQLKKARQPLEAIRALEEELKTMEEKTQAPVERKSGERSAVGNQPLKLGEKVRIASLQSEGIVTALSETEAEVQIGTLRVRARLNDLEKPAASGEQPKRRAPIEPDYPPPAPKPPPTTGMQISLRGKLVEDGLAELDKYLEKAYAAGLPFVRIVHGKGTGKMREAVRSMLKDSPYVRSYEEAKDNEGGAGVTIATMAK